MLLVAACRNGLSGLACSSLHPNSFPGVDLGVGAREQVVVRRAVELKPLLEKPMKMGEKLPTYVEVAVDEFWTRVYDLGGNHGEAGLADMAVDAMYNAILRYGRERLEASTPPAVVSDENASLFLGATEAEQVTRLLQAFAAINSSGAGKLNGVITRLRAVAEAARKVHSETRFIDDEGCTSHACTLTSHGELGDAIGALRP